MKTILRTALASAALVVSAMGASSAGAQTTLTFDDLGQTFCYGAGTNCPVVSNGNALSYTSNGYIMTLVGGAGSHIGDGFSAVGTYNWHIGGDNTDDAYVRLTKVGGGAFDLLGFSYASSQGMTVSAIGNLPLVLAAGSSTSNGFANVTSVNFFGSGNNLLDNIRVADATSAVPEPATWAMMLVGFGAIGGTMRRRRTTRASFA